MLMGLEAGGRGGGEGSMNAKGYGISFVGGQNVLKLIMVMVI